MIFAMKTIDAVGAPTTLPHHQKKSARSLAAQPLISKKTNAPNGFVGRTNAINNEYFATKNSVVYQAGR